MTFAEFNELWLNRKVRRYALIQAIDIETISGWSCKNEILLLSPVRYLFSMVHNNGYIPRGGKEDLISIAIAGIVSVAR